MEVYQVHFCNFPVAGCLTHITQRGGANRIAQAMREQLLSDSILLGKRVTKIAPVKHHPTDVEAYALEVHVENDKDVRRYSYVISTVPLGCLRMIDLDECKLSYALREALRSLQYGPSVKIGMRFTHRWWEQLGHYGGVSSTDRLFEATLLSRRGLVLIIHAFRLSRMIVYPSYGLGGDTGATMLVRCEEIPATFPRQGSFSFHVLQLFVVAGCSSPCYPHQGERPNDGHGAPSSGGDLG